jgi:hypothetical protein
MFFGIVIIGVFAYNKITKKYIVVPFIYDTSFGIINYVPKTKSL